MSTTKIIERGDIFASSCRVLVNPVNCVGVSGKGLAKEFKSRMPRSVAAYEADCRRVWPRLGIGRCQDYAVPEHRGRRVIFFPTKNHWRDQSNIGDIATGLSSLDGLIALAPDRYTSIAIPALGCGLGQLSWTDVLPLIQNSAARLNECGVSVEIYAPLEGT